MLRLCKTFLTFLYNQPHASLVSAHTIFDNLVLSCLVRRLKRF